MEDSQAPSGISVLISPDEYFSDLVRAGFERRRINSYPAIQLYIANLLKFYVHAQNLFDDLNPSDVNTRKPSTLAEMYLVAANADFSEKVELLRRLGDRSLYISGFFGDSLTRKIVDVDYYAEMGGAAYASLAETIKEDTQAQVYRVISRKFLDFVDVLTDISHHSLFQGNQNILRLYDRYLRTGSPYAKEKLAEMGIMTIPADQSKLARQD